MAENKLFTQDYIVEQGTSNDGIWTYRKWNSGLAECFGRYTRQNVTTDLFTAWGDNLYQTDIVDNNDNRLNYPISFIEPPIETARVCSDKYALWTYTNTNGNPTNTKSGYYKAVRIAEPKSVATLTLDIIAYGKWE